MGEDGFSIEEAYRVTSKHGPIETFKRDLNKVGTGKYWMYTEEYFYPRQCKLSRSFWCEIYLFYTLIFSLHCKGGSGLWCKQNQRGTEYSVFGGYRRQSLVIDGLHQGSDGILSGNAKLVLIEVVEFVPHLCLAKGGVDKKKIFFKTAVFLYFSGL